MSSAAPADRSRIRKRDEDGQRAADHEQRDPIDGSADGWTGANQAESAAAATDGGPGPTHTQQQSHGVQPLPEQTRKRQRLSCLLDSLAVVELQLVMQWLDAKSRLQAARCSRRLLHAGSHSCTWKDAPPFVVKASMADDVERILPSLLRYAPIHLRCTGMASLECVAAVPHLRVLELNESPPVVAASLAQLLQHPCVARLQSLRLDETTSFLAYRAHAMPLIARLPELCTLDLGMPTFEPAQSAALLQPLAEAPTLTDLSLRWAVCTTVDTALLESITRMACLRRLSLKGLTDSGEDTFRSFFTSPNIRRLQHLRLECFYVSYFFGIEAPSAVEYEATFSAMQQLQSLTLARVFGIAALLPHLRHAPSLRLLSVRCQPQSSSFGHLCPLLLNRPALAELLAAAPQLEVRLLLPSLERWLALGSSTADPDGRAQYVEQWNELHRMPAELDRVAIVYDESP